MSSGLTVRGKKPGSGIRPMVVSLEPLQELRVDISPCPDRCPKWERVWQLGFKQGERSYLITLALRVDTLSRVAIVADGAKVRPAYAGVPPRVRRVVSLALTTTMNSATSDASSILEGGELKPGIYKIQNLCAQTYMDIHEHLREVCCRPATALEEGRGFVRPFVSLYCACLRIRSGKSSLSGLDTPYGG